MPKRSWVVAAETPLLEIRAGPLRLARLEQHLAVPRDRRLERLAEASTATVLPRRPRAELDPGTLGQPGQGLAEVQPVAAHDEREDVAVLSAAEAVPRLALGRDDEGRCLLGVERAEALLDRSRTLERNGLADDVGDREASP